MRIAFVHDWLTSHVGSEKTLETMAALYPRAPIFTLVHAPERFTGTALEGRDIRTSFIERLPRGRAKYRSYLPLMPLAIEQFDLSEFDVVVSSSHAVAKGVLTRADQLHLSYVYTPIRYAWELYSQYLRESGLHHGVKGWLAKAALHYLRIWDAASANRVDKFAAISQCVARRIEKTYRRDAEVIYPPVEVAQFLPATQRNDFYLVVSRMVPYKKNDLIVEAFTKLGRPLVVIGEGPDFEKVKAKAGTNVRLLGWQEAGVVADHMARCRAFIFAAEEDFGIAPLEAQAAGAPVIAWRRGGVTETIVDGETGLFFEEQTVESLMDAVNRFEQHAGTFDVARLRANAARFSKERFQREFTAWVEREWEAFRRRA